MDIAAVLVDLANIAQNLAELTANCGGSMFSLYAMILGRPLFVVDNNEND